MSKNIRSKPQATTKPRSDALKRTLSTNSSTEPKKSPIKPTSKTKTVASKSKDEEKKKVPSTRQDTQQASIRRIPTGTATKSSSIKPLPSKLNTKTTASTVPPKSRLVPEKKNSTLTIKSTPGPSKPKAISSRPPSTKPNLVKDTVHNVTVSSPPSKRRELPKEPLIIEEDSRASKTRAKAEKVVDKKITTVVEPVKNVSEPEKEDPVQIKEPVAFEVIFEENQKPLEKSKSPAPSDSSPDYEDDFESYESDFETGSSSVDVASRSSSSLDSSRRENHESSSTSTESEDEPEAHSEEDEESELTQYPITVIHRDKEQERKLDSGNYDLHSKKRRAMEPFDSLDTLANYEQLDSGISYENSVATVTLDPASVAIGGYHQFYSNPKITKRGVEIMSKIQLDQIAFTLLDLKPIAYDTYMRMFGSSNTVQSMTQTHEDRLEGECQTDEYEVRSVWTQHPPQYDLVTIQRSAGTPYCTGELTDHAKAIDLQYEDPFDGTIRGLSKLRLDTPLTGNRNHHKPVNFEHLNSFLNKSSPLISRILSLNAPEVRLEKTDLPKQSNGFFKLNTRLLNALKVVRVFANAKFSLVLTVHESIANVYRNDFSNLIMVWNTGDAAKPVRLLSTWSEVCQAEICNESSDIVVCGLRDGSIAMWDLRETYSFCSKLDGYLTHFAATHSITPSWGGIDMQSFDLGAVIDVKSFRSPTKTITSLETLKTIQFASLNETGILAIWTLVETGVRGFEVTQKQPESKFEYSSPWARVKLIQSAICDLREFIELGNVRPKSAFERTKSNFQMQIFEDDVLKELAATKNDMKLGLQGLRFINLDCGTELIFVGTNRNFVISCSKTLKKERFRKMSIVDSGYLFPTAIKLLQNEDFLVVGLSNGSVIILNCNQEQKFNKHHEMHNHEQLPRKATAQTRTSDIEFEIGKSCAIQNIIRNERRPAETRLAEDDFRPNTVAIIETMIEGGKKPFELRVFDEQVLLNGSVLRKDLVQSLELSSDGWTLFALSNGDIRAYDFYTEKEVQFSSQTSGSRKIMELAVNRGGRGEKQLILLNESNEVQVHLLN